MKRVSVRDLRQKWPEAERALNIESELVITRDGEPVARLTRYENRSKKTAAFRSCKTWSVAEPAGNRQNRKLGGRIPH